MSWKGHCKNALFALALTSLIAPQAEAIEIFMGANAATLHPQEYVAGRLREALAHHNRSPWFLCSLFPTLKHDIRASLTCRNIGSSSAAMKSPTPQKVPTLPTPTALMARSNRWKRSNSVRTCSGNEAR